MSVLQLAVQAMADTSTSAPNTDPGAELIAFWILAPLAVLGAIGMVFSKSAVHSALWLVLTMLSLGCLYINQNAEFLGFVQIIVYTGAIMMLFLFVLMLTGRDSGDSTFEVLRKQRIVALVLGIGFVVLLGGCALDFEIPELIATAVAPSGIVCGTGNVRGTEGPRNAVASGLVASYASSLEPGVGANA